MSEKPSPEDTALWQRRLASQANNRAWALSEATSRSAAEDADMLDAAHAAMYFWKIVGAETNVAHALQLLAHVYATFKQAQPAAAYLAKAQAVFDRLSLQPWEVALGHAVAANVAAAASDAVGHRSHHQQALALVAALSDAQDRSILEATLRVLPLPPT